MLSLFSSLVRVLSLLTVQDCRAPQTVHFRACAMKGSIADYPCHAKRFTHLHDGCCAPPAALLCTMC